MTAYPYHPYPAVRAYAITAGNAVTVTADLARAQQLAPHMHGVISTLYNAPALWQELQGRVHPANPMNRVSPDPTAIHIGAIEHLALCMSIANTAALHTVCAGTIMPGDGGTWWLDMASQLDPALHSAEHVAAVSQHIAVAVFAGLVERHPQHPLRLRIIVGQGHAHAQAPQQLQQLDQGAA